MFSDKHTAGWMDTTSAPLLCIHVLKSNSTYHQIQEFTGKVKCDTGRNLCKITVRFALSESKGHSWEDLYKCWTSENFGGFWRTNTVTGVNAFCIAVPTLRASFVPTANNYFLWEGFFCLGFLVSLLLLMFVFPILWLSSWGVFRNCDAKLALFCHLWWSDRASLTSGKQSFAWLVLKYNLPFLFSGLY